MCSRVHYLLLGAQGPFKILDKTDVHSKTVQEGWRIGTQNQELFQWSEHGAAQP